jgi:PAS domain S-box-containing protein
MNEFGNPPKEEGPTMKNFHFSAIAKKTTDAIIGKDLNGNVTTWNPGAQRMFGYSDEEMIEQSITRIILEQRL